MGLTAGGSVEHTKGNKAVDTGELVSVVGSLKKAALQFGETLDVDCPVVHVRGATHMFSCYDVDAYVCAFFTPMAPEALDAFDTTEADKEMAGVIEEMGMLLRTLAGG